MKRITLFSAWMLLCSISLLAQTQFQKSVYFDTDKHDLTPTSKAALNQIIQQITELSDYAVEVKAHTDDRGTIAYNEALAQRRATSVADYLTQVGITTTKTTIKSFGEKNPTYANTDEQGRSKNRRVDVIVTAFTINSLDDLFTRLSKDNLQTYTISANKNTLLTAKNGTQFKIDANSFAFADGTTPQGDITIEIKEAYSYKDMLTNELSTTSDGKMLETGGMIYMNAQVNGEKLELKEGTDIEVGMPTPNREEGMQLFVAQTANDGSMDWSPTYQDYETDFSKKIKLNIPKEPTRPFNRATTMLIPVDKGPKPAKPTKPSKPIKPGEPTASSIKYTPTFFEKVFTSKEKLEEKKDVLYAKRVKNYEKSLEIYQGKLERYLVAKQQYEIDIVDYKLALSEWEAKPKTIKQPIPEAQKKRNAATYKKELQAYKKSYKVWLQLKEKALEDYEAAYEERGAVSFKDVQNYVFKVNKIGWINCDRFSNDPAPRMPLVINDGDKVPERIFILFDDINSMMKAKRTEQNRYVCNDLPANAKVTIIGLKVIHGKTYMAQLETQVDAQNRYNLAYMPTTLKEIRKVLSNS